MKTTEVDLWTPAPKTNARRVASAVTPVGSRDKRPLICYNCGRCGHTSQQCLSKAFLCGTRKSVGYRGKKQPVRQLFHCECFVQGWFVNDIVSDTGCSRDIGEK